MNIGAVDVNVATGSMKYVGPSPARVAAPVIVLSEEHDRGRIGEPIGKLIAVRGVDRVFVSSIAVTDPPPIPGLMLIRVDAFPVWTGPNFLLIAGVVRQ